VSLSDAEVQAEVEGIAREPADSPDDAALRRQIEALPEKQRQAVTLYYLDERPVDEVAAMMGIPVNTAKTHLHRARASLAAALGAAGEVTE
jgi:RNA polymerase sigma-70 factor (ECF subfamily)